MLDIIINIILAFIIFYAGVVYGKNITILHHNKHGKF